MFDPLSLAVGAGLLGAGWVVGRYARRPARATAVVARCGCGHDLSMHDPEKGLCHSEIRRRNMGGLYEWIQCGCRRYTGPQPIEELFSRPILPPTD
ncbi:hypothetical protein [Nocardia goodfellowii]|uniref:Uncharacterized protein n=1 Tax=Nocardia goodfellowii TaxID=882446 RepID=A0ABS4QEC0_9NOCA|nr:hypothetical protein [Nocardia goodfellowii]MBP2190037.1 hypothetical protein [Nocardia goodfellowii]